MWEGEPNLLFQHLPRLRVQEEGHHNCKWLDDLVILKDGLMSLCPFILQAQIIHGDSDAQPGVVTRDSVHQPWSSSNTSLIDIVVIDCEVVGGYETPDG